MKVTKVYVEMIRKDGELKQWTDREFTCVLCGSDWIGWGNNPWPLGDANTDKCCDFCNQSEVIPARLKGINEKAAG